MPPEDYYYQYLKPRVLDNKELVLGVSKDIEHSFTGRVDVMSLHGFFLEASSLINNSIRQFEQGFFDAAFYSVRSALELARIVAYFSHQDQPIESDIYKKWTSGGKFPYDSQIRDMLDETSAVYGEVRGALSDFFDEQDNKLKRAQKYIHKQGYKTFYNQNAWRPDLQKARTENINDFFKEFLTSSTAEIAILRLCIDPFPVLLQDEAVMYKVHYQSMTEAYKKETIEFIGEENISRYCNTDFYRSHVHFFSENEQLQEVTYNIINHQFYDRTQKTKLRKQLHLLTDDDRLAVSLLDVSDNITKVYLHNGWIWYFTNTNSKKKNWGFDSTDLHKLIDATDKINTDYDGAYLSFFSNEDNQCWTEHNSKLTQHQINKIGKILRDTGKK